ncbi:hypothetical protein ACFE04_029789 [Oxalis oulophora]
MQLDILKFLQSPGQQQFEFQHLPTSYIRLAAHRVAQHYGLVTMVQDNGLEVTGNVILAIKQGETKYPVVRLSEISVKHSENDKPEPLKIAIMPRLNKGFTDGANESKRNAVKSVEERKEDYEKARARIFSSPSSPKSGNFTPNLPTEGNNLRLSRDENENWQSSIIEADNFSRGGGSSSRVAIFRDREKDMTDPDYDRSYERYFKSLPTNQHFNFAPDNMQTVQIPFVPYDNCFPQSVQMLGAQASPSYRPPSSNNPVTNPFCAVGLYETPRNPAFGQWPSVIPSSAVADIRLCAKPLDGRLRGRELYQTISYSLIEIRCTYQFLVHRNECQILSLSL